MIKAIFFDFDGTISDAKSLSQNSFIETFEELGYKFDKKKLRELLGLKTPEILAELGIPTSNTSKVRRHYWKKMFIGVNAGKIKLCVSLKPLEKLKNDGIELGIITNGSRKFLKISLKKLGIKNLFSRLYASEDFKTKDKMLKKLFRKYKVRPHEVLYVGDRFSDVEYARKAGCYAVAIHNKCSWSSLALIKKENPDFIIKDFRGLKKIVEVIK
jgi:HAD superfamily hydrolase (TIGR01549 family)